MKKRQQVDYAAELQKDHDRWIEIFTRGSSDPFWRDGMGLYLKRNHIINGRRHIEETMLPEDYPAIYYKEVPPEMDMGYMARKGEIRTAAKVSLAQYKSGPNYQYILRHQDDFTPKTKRKLCIDAVLGYVTGLEHAIEHDDLVAMRRHEMPDRYLKSFEECAKKMQETPTEEVQLSLFSFSASGVDEPNDGDYDEDEDEEFGGMTMM